MTVGKESQEKLTDDGVVDWCPVSVLKEMGALTAKELTVCLHYHDGGHECVPESLQISLETVHFIPEIEIPCWHRWHLISCKHMVHYILEGVCQIQQNKNRLMALKGSMAGRGKKNHY